MYSLNTWITMNIPAPRFFGAMVAQEQFRFFDKLQGLVNYNRGSERDNAIVISTHTSKSIVLPVVRYMRPDLGITFTVRDNFHDCKLSVASTKPIDDPLFPYLFHTTPPTEPDYTGDNLSWSYFEGFPKEAIFGYQALNHHQWSCAIGSGPDALWQVMYICMVHAGGIPPRIWRTRESCRVDAADAARALKGQV